MWILGSIIIPSLMVFFIYARHKSLIKYVICKSFLLLCGCLFTFLMMSTEAPKFLILMKHSLCTFCCFFFWCHMVDTIVYLKATRINTRVFFEVFYSFTSCVQVCGWFELIFVYFVRKEFNLIVLCMWTCRGSRTKWMVLAALRKISWP